MKFHSTCIFVNKYYAKTMRTLVLPICILSAERKVFCGFKWHLISSRAHLSLPFTMFVPSQTCPIVHPKNHHRK